MANKTILLKGDPLRKEAKASAAITPGPLIQLDTTSGKVKMHASSGQPAAAMFAIENSLAGKDIDTAYAANDRVQYIHARPGDEVYAWLKAGENVAIGDYLQSGGDGTLVKYEAGSAGVVEYPKSIVAQALAALDLSASSATATRLKVVIV